MGRGSLAVELRAEKRRSITAKVLLSLGIVLAVGLVVMTVLVLERKRVEQKRNRRDASAVEPACVPGMEPWMPPRQDPRPLLREGRLALRRAWP